MKKLLTFVFFLGSAIAALTSCSKNPCDQCGSTESVSSYEKDGVKVNLCSRCKSNLDATLNLMNSISIR